MIIGKPTIIKVNAYYMEYMENIYKIMLLWNNNIVETNQESHVEIHLIDDSRIEKIRFNDNIIDTSNYNVRFESWRDKGQTFSLTIRTYNEIGLYQELTIPVLLSEYPNTIPISIRNGYLDFNSIKDGINGINIGWDFPTQQEANSLFCYSILISGYTPQERQTIYIPNPSNGIFVPYFSIAHFSGIKNITIYAINNNEQSGEPYIYNSKGG